MRNMEDSVDKAKKESQVDDSIMPSRKHKHNIIKYLLLSVRRKLGASRVMSYGRKKRTG